MSVHRDLEILYGKQYRGPNEPILVSIIDAANGLEAFAKYIGVERKNKSVTQVPCTAPKLEDLFNDNF